MNRSSRRRLRFESLEARQLMAYDVSFSGGVLDVEGGAGSDQIDIFYNLNTAQSTVVVQISNRDTEVILLRADRPIGEVARVDVHSFNGNDGIFNNTTIPMRAWGGNDNDDLFGGLAGDELHGEAGKDTLVGSLGNDLLDGGSENDSFLLDPGNDTLRGGPGDDAYVYYPPVLFGAPEGSHSGADCIDETSAVELNRLSFSNMWHGVTFNLGLTTIQPLGDGASIQLASGIGLANLEGSTFDDLLIGNFRNNQILGSGGADILVGGPGDDELVGSFGDDRYSFLAGQNGSDTIREEQSAGGGSDTLDFSNFGQAIAINLNNSVAVQNSQLKLTLANRTFIENVTGSAFADTIIGSAANNVLFGRGGNDYIRAGAGNDTINGEAGSDTVYAEDGSDRISTDAADFVYGGLGRDIFDGLLEGGGKPYSKAKVYRDWGII